MTDERSKAAVKAAIDFGEGRISKEELNAARAARAAAADDAYHQNQMITASIVRDILGSEIIEKVNTEIND
jgi:hypothetical protein